MKCVDGALVCVDDGLMCIDDALMLVDDSVVCLDALGCRLMTPLSVPARLHVRPRPFIRVSMTRCRVLMTRCGRDMLLTHLLEDETRRKHTVLIALRGVSARLHVHSPPFSFA